MLPTPSSLHVRLFVPFAFQIDECRWHEDPASSIVHFAMNVADTPLSAAISFTPCL